MNNIKKMRLLSGLSQEQFASRVGVHQTAVSQRETGKAYPAASVIPKLLSVFNCKYEDLFPDYHATQAGGNEND